jgi:hypothetical protein
MYLQLIDILCLKNDILCKPIHPLYLIMIYYAYFEKQAGEKLDYKIVSRSDYLGKSSYHKLNIRISYYTRKQMKTIYPNHNFRVVGEVGNKSGIQFATAENIDEQPLPVYKERTHNNLTESIIGYTAVDDHTYLVVVKNTFLRIILLWVLFLAISGAAAIIIATHSTW